MILAHARKVMTHRSASHDGLGAQVGTSAEYLRVF